MTSLDLLYFFQWYIVLFILGAAFFPLASKIFSPFSDKGYGFSKIIGLFLTSYLVFVLGVSRIVQFHTVTVILVILLISGISIFLLIPRPMTTVKKKITSFFSTSWKLLLFEEVLFLVALYFLSYIRAFAPDIHGLEKYMDFGFINSVYRADFFPPKDMWFTPLPINYYYFGHLATAVLTKLSGLPTNITYNLMLGTMFAMTVSGAFSLVYNLITTFSTILKKQAYVFGLIAALILSLGGNLHTIYTFFEPYDVEKPVPFWELPFEPTSYPNAYWYPNATRFIYNTIHEFPMYSWTVSDLHGHVLDIPFVLLLIGVLFSFFCLSQSQQKIISGRKKPVTHTSIGLLQRIKTRYLLFIGLLLSVMYMTNAWDGMIYFLLACFVLLFLEGQRVFERNELKNHPLYSFLKRQNFSFIVTSKILNTLTGAATAILIVVLGSIFFSLPFSLSFKPFVSGIGVLCAPTFLTDIGKIGPFLFETDHCQHSLWWQLIILHGFFYFFVFSFLLFLWKVKKTTLADNFVLLLIVLSTLLILIPEFVYVKDIYPGHYRANTMFKLVFQAFMMLSLSSGYILFRILSSDALSVKRKGVFLVISTVLLTLIFLYPFQAINSYYGELRTYKGLDGTAYLNDLYPDDYRAIKWLNENVPNQPVILEAQGDAYGGSSSYTDYARVSANTGLPTVLGWTVHEWLWRGTYDIPAPRIEEVRLMYESENSEDVTRLLSTYEISYVFVGALEREKYPNLNMQNFELLGEEVYRSGDTTIYKLNKNYTQNVPVSSEE